MECWRGYTLLGKLWQRPEVRLYSQRFRSFLIGYSAAVMTTTLVRDYLLHYAQSHIYTTSLSYANIIATHCSFDMLTNGAAQHVSSSPHPRKHKATYMIQVVQPPSLPLILFDRNPPKSLWLSCLSHPPPISFTFKPSISHCPCSGTPPTPALRLPPRAGP
jgi:hypothetical protein